MDRPSYAPRIRNRTLTEPTTPVAKFWNAKKAEPDSTAADELWIYDEIGFSWWDEGITAASFAKELAQLTGDRLTVRINSPGGDVFDGLAIGNLLAEHPATKTIKVDALAASIASVVAVKAASKADDRIVMGRQAQMMIHDASGFAMGTSVDMLEMAALLDMISTNIAGVYADRAGGTAASWRKVMTADGDKWYSAEEAVAAGLADSVAEPPVQHAPADPGADAPSASAARLRAAADWCGRLFPGHEIAFEAALATLPVATEPLPEPEPDDEPEPEPDDKPEPEPDVTMAWSSGLAEAFRTGVTTVVAPVTVDVEDWRGWFDDAPGATLAPRNEPADLGPPPPKPPTDEPPPPNRLAQAIAAAVHLTATDQPAPDEPAPDAPPAPLPLRLDVQDVRRAVREARY